MSGSYYLLPHGHASHDSHQRSSWAEFAYCSRPAKLKLPDVCREHFPCACVSPYRDDLSAAARETPWVIFVLGTNLVLEPFCALLPVSQLGRLLGRLGHGRTTSWQPHKLPSRAALADPLDQRSPGMVPFEPLGSLTTHVEVGPEPTPSIEPGSPVH